MRVTKFSDYSLRVLIYLGSKPGQDLTTISEISNAFSISVHHVRMVVHKIRTVRVYQLYPGQGWRF